MSDKNIKIKDLSRGIYFLYKYKEAYHFYFFKLKNNPIKIIGKTFSVLNMNIEDKIYPTDMFLIWEY